MSQNDTFEEFRSICGLEGDENDVKVRQLLQIHDYDLNSALLVYFDSGFESVQEPSTTGAQIHEETNQLHRRSHSDGDGAIGTPDYGNPSNNRAVEFSNLQSQMYMENFLPRLPKSGKISNNWQLELGIYSSLQSEKDSGNGGNSSLRKPLNLWIILLFIPKTILHLIVSALKYFFGSSSTITNKFPRTFNYEQYHSKFSIKDWLVAPETDDEITLIGEKASQDDDAESKNDAKTVTSESSGDIYEQFNIQDSNFNEAHDECQKGYLWLIVILVNDSPESQAWTVDLLSNGHFQRLFNKNSGEYKENIIFINNVNRSPEAHAVGQNYKVRRLPYIMLCGNVSNNPGIMASMSIVYKSNLSSNFLAAGELSTTNKKIVRNLSRLCENFNPQLISSRFDKQEIEFSRLMVKQQDDAYEQSLQQDREKKIAKELEITRKQIQKRDQRTKKRFIEEKLNSEFFAAIKGSTKMAIKLPNGTRIIESFHEDISVQQLYLFIELKIYEQKQTQEESCEDTEEEEEDASDANDLEVEAINEKAYYERFPFNFEIVQPFPKRVIKCQLDHISSVDELRSGANLLVEYIIED